MQNGSHNGASALRASGSTVLQPPLHEAGNEELINSIKNPNTFNYRLHWKFSRGEHEACDTMLSKWKLQSCKNYEYGHFLQSKLHRKKGNLGESIKSIKLCYMIDPHNLNYVKETAKTL